VAYRQRLQSLQQEQSLDAANERDEEETVFARAHRESQAASAERARDAMRRSFSQSPHLNFVAGTGKKIFVRSLSEVDDAV